MWQRVTQDECIPTQLTLTACRQRAFCCPSCPSRVLRLAPRPPPPGFGGQSSLGPLRSIPEETTDPGLGDQVPQRGAEKE